MLFILTWSTNVMDGRTDTSWQQRPRLYIASCSKNYWNSTWFDKVIAKLKWCNFFALQCIIYTVGQKIALQCNVMSVCCSTCIQLASYTAWVRCLLLVRCHYTHWVSVIVSVCQSSVCLLLTSYACQSSQCIGYLLVTSVNHLSVCYLLVTPVNHLSVLVTY